MLGIKRLVNDLDRFPVLGEAPVSPFSRMILLVLVGPEYLEEAWISLEFIPDFGRHPLIEADLATVLCWSEVEELSESNLVLLIVKRELTE